MSRFSVRWDIDTPQDFFDKLMGTPPQFPLVMRTLMYDNRGCIIHKNIDRVVKERREEAYLKYCEKKKYYEEKMKKNTSAHRKLQINRINYSRTRYRVGGAFVSKEEQEILEKLSDDENKFNEFIEIIKLKRKCKKI